MSPEMPKGLMELVQEMVLGYGVEALAEELGKSPNTLYKEVNPNPEEGRTHKFGLLDFRRVTNRTRDYRALHKLCLECDHVAVAIPPGRPGNKDWFSRLSRISKEFGDHVAAVGEALADGRLDRQEARAVLAELDELIEAAVADRLELLRLLEPEEAHR